MKTMPSNKIKITENDIKNFPQNELKIDPFWDDLYNYSPNKKKKK